VEIAGPNGANPERAMNLLAKIAGMQKLQKTRIDGQKWFKLEPGIEFLFEQVRKAKYDLDGQVKPYFELTTVLEKESFAAKKCME
jgi:Zn-dependent oligopeptidase